MRKVGSKKYNVLNKSKPRLDGGEKVTGRARYAADMYMENMLHAKVKHSPYAHAKVKSIDTSKAKAIPGVAAVVTFEDIPKQRSWASYMYLTGTIRYAGDCVAMVAAETLELADEALAAIEVEYEPLPVVATIEEALADDAPVIHEKYPDNIFTESHFKIRKGDVEKGFEEADVVVERNYSTQFVEHAYIEPEAVFAYENPNDGTMTVHSSSQNPFFTRRYIADILDAPMNKVRLIQETLGGSFGGKEEGVGVIAGRAAYLSQLTGRPVKMVNSRETSILESSKRHPLNLHYKAGVKKDGTIVAWEGEQIDNCGAYNNQTQFMNWRAAVHSSGPYEIPNIKTDTYGVFTNNIHGGAMRGYSSPQLIFGQEQFIEEIGEELGLDPVEIRRANCLREGSLTTTSDIASACTIAEIMDYTVEQTEFLRKLEKNKKQDPDARKKKGIGMSIAYRGGGLGKETPDAAGCMMIINEDGSAIIVTGLSENGQGLKTAYAQIAAEASGLSVKDISAYGADSNYMADSGMTVASRGTVMASQATRLAGESMKQVMRENTIDVKGIPLEDVEKHYGLKEGTLSWNTISPNDIEILDSEIYLLEYPEVKVTLKDVANSSFWSGNQLSVYEWHKPPELIQDHDTGQGQAYPNFSYECLVAEVEVDMKTGFVSVEHVTASHDVGTVVNPGLAKGQIYGGIVMGMGFALMEEVDVEEGRVKNQNLDTYLIPTSLDAPEMTVNLFESDDNTGTYGTKSLGEPATEAIGAAIANAIYNATGRRIRHNPADLEKVLLGRKLVKPVNKDKKQTASSQATGGVE